MSAQVLLHPTQACSRVAALRVAAETGRVLLVRDRIVQLIEAPAAWSQRLADRIIAKELQS